MEKTNIGSKLALYPMPVTVIGTMDGDKPEWLQVDYVSIIGHSRILVSMIGKHLTNPAIKASKKLSIQRMRNSSRLSSDMFLCDISVSRHTCI